MKDVGEDRNFAQEAKDYVLGKLKGVDLHPKLKVTWDAIGDIALVCGPSALDSMVDAIRKENDMMHKGGE
jgi:hypothetical protein